MGKILGKIVQPPRNTLVRTKNGQKARKKYSPAVLTSALQNMSSVDNGIVKYTSNTKCVQGDSILNRQGVCMWAKNISGLS